MIQFYTLWSTLTLKLTDISPNLLHINKVYESIIEDFKWSIDSVPSGPWFHGTTTSYDEYDTEAVKLNRGTNLSGLYLTLNQNEAKSFGPNVYQYEVNVENTYDPSTSAINQRMIDAYGEIATKYYSNQEWITSAIVPEFVETRKMKGDIKGSDKTHVFQAGGYDSYKDGDHLVVFHPSNHTRRIK